ncbi:hypothetical protein ANO11243_061340 [Dothideomycetidae sp. 11243]|nr:hypothetical protein ANO11243_061340 [fungal sp. No.11243]
MDRSTGPQSPVKPGSSGLPRLSKLPTPQPSRIQAPPSLSSSRIGAVPSKSPGLTSPTKPLTGSSTGRRVSGIAAPIVHAPRPSSSQAHRLVSPTKPIPSRTAVNPSRSSTAKPTFSRPRPKSVQIGSTTRHREDEAMADPGDQPRRISGSTLWDRTIESLAQLPSTPATERRRSGVFAAQSPIAVSPMGPPARPASSLSLSKRPGNVANIGTRTLPKALSPIKSTTPAGSMAVRGTVETKRAPASRRSMSATIPRSLTSAASTPSSSATFSRPRGHTATLQRPAMPGKKAVPPSATSLAQRKPILSPQKKGMLPPPRASLIRTPSPVEHDGRQMESALKSSSAFRQAIEKAKAAQKVFDGARKGDFDIEIDPFNQKTRRDENPLLRKRVDAARMDGKLTLSGMDLDYIPNVVLQMYDSQSMTDSGIAWNEAMDLSIFQAADNNLSSLSEDAFPDVDPEDSYNDENVKVSIFAGVDHMDLRGNTLLALPMGMRHLRRLTSLNLTRNELGNSVFDLLSQLDSLKELYLGENSISGFLPQSVAALTKLEVLDLRKNRILNVPESIRSMQGLRILNVSGNQLTGVPMDALETLPIVELDVSGNALVGALFPFGVAGLKHIQELNVSNNSLASLAFSESVSLPNIRILKISNNRMVTLPDMSAWSELVTLAAGGNKINALPHGFVSLRRLRNADFSSNDITKIDERIVLMDSLESLVISANPLIERKYLTMTAEAIKRDLRNRSATPSTSQRTSESFEDEAIDVRSPKDSPAAIKVSPDGELDLSGQGLVDEDADGLRSLLGLHDIRNLQLSRNNFTMIPYELSLAQNLRSLDLSMCELGSHFLEESLTLMSLQYLQLSGNRISSLDPLMDVLHAPHLRHLDVSNNCLTGPLPALRSTFVHLQDLHAADNKIKSVSIDALRGLGTVVLARNDIAQLPAEIGLLWFEGLKVIDFTSNAFRVPSYTILDKGTEATLAWLREKIPNYAGDDETF